MQKSKEKKTTGDLLVLENQRGFEDRRLTKKNKSRPQLDSAAAAVCALFPRRDVSIWKREGQKRWMQWTRPLEAFQIVGVMSDQGRGLYRGCYFGAETRHGVIDIDIESKYHNLESLAGLVADFIAIGLPLVPYQSSNSGGWHLYFYFDRYAPSQEVEATIKDYLRARKYEIKSGTLEVFPSGNALRLPLQQGFAWLSLNGKIKKGREELSQDEALERFAEDIKENQANWQEVKSLIGSQISLIRSAAGDAGAGMEESPDDEGFEGLFRGGLDWEKYQRGREYWQQGLTSSGQRHDAVFCIGHYLWYGDKASGVLPLPYSRNAKARAAKIRDWLQANHNGQSKAVNSGDHREVAGQIERATSWTRQTPLIKEKYESYPLTERLLKRLEWLYQKTGKLWTIEELEKANVDRSLDARHRIAVAIAQLEAEGAQLTQAAVAIRAGACRKTVRRHSDLFAAWGGVYNGGSGGFVEPEMLLASSVENGFDRSVPAALESKADVIVFPCGLTESQNGSSGFEVVVSRPVSESLFDFFVSSPCLSGSRASGLKVFGSLRVVLEKGGRGPPKNRI